MNPMRYILTFAFSASALASLVAACSTGGDGFRLDPVLLGPDASLPDVACGTRCSRDLRSVVRECDGTVVKQCETGMACGDGQCLEACAASTLSKGSIGCSFWTLPPDPYRNDVEGSCFAAVVANAWSEPASIEADFGGAPLDIARSVYRVTLGNKGPVYERLDGKLPPGQVAVVFLSGRKGTAADFGEGKLFVPCPSEVEPAIKVDPTAHRTGLSKAFHLKTSLPISAYSMFPYGGFQSFLPSATLLLPEGSLATNYVFITAWPAIDGDPSAQSRPFVQVVATEDDTEVAIRPSVDIADGVGVVGVGAGSVRTYKLARGQVLQISQVADVIGSAMESTKPVALFGGNTCFAAPDGFAYCETGHQQTPPLSQWGRQYAAVPYRSRLGLLLGSTTERNPESIPYRVIGAAKGTTLTYHPRRPLGAPDTLGPGELFTFMSTDIFTVESQDADHPFYMANYMTGSTYVRGSGDPEFVNSVAAEQYLDDYQFYVDYTFPESSLTFVRRRERGEFRDVTLDCKGVLTGWQPIEGAPDFEYLWLDVSRGGQPIAPCGYGSQHARSDGPFTVNVWGWGQDSSYGYPAGQGSRPLSSVKFPVR